MTWAEGRKIIRVYSAPAESDFPALLPWKDKYLSPDNFVLVLGESLTGPVTVNLTNIPHILLGGSTGSGKSVLLKLLLMQALRKGAEVYIDDFKGGVDFPKVWRQKCHMCFQEDTLLYVLGQLVAVLEAARSGLMMPGVTTWTHLTRPLGRGFPGWYSPVTRWRNCWTGQAGARRTETSSIRSKTGLPPLHAWGGPLVFT